MRSLLNLLLIALLPANARGTFLLICLMHTVIPRFWCRELSLIRLLCPIHKPASERGTRDGKTGSFGGARRCFCAGTNSNLCENGESTFRRVGSVQEKFRKNRSSDCPPDRIATRGRASFLWLLRHVAISRPNYFLG